jgi:hypothetical protein
MPRARSNDGIPPNTCPHCGFHAHPERSCIDILRDRIAMLEFAANRNRGRRPGQRCEAVLIDGKTIAQLASETGLRPGLIRSRAKRGLPLELILDPLKHSGRPRVSA